MENIFLATINPHDAECGTNKYIRPRRGKGIFIKISSTDDTHVHLDTWEKERIQKISASTYFCFWDRRNIPTMRNHV